MNNQDEWLIKIATISGYIISIILGIYYFSDIVNNTAS
jgi:hypothetical protein